MLVRAGSTKRFGLITTNSLRQTFAHCVVQMHLKGGAGHSPAPVGDPPTGMGKA